MDAKTTTAVRGFAERAEHGWSAPTSAFLSARHLARKSVLALANQTFREPTGNFVRCLYGHAVFPEQRETLRNLVRYCRNRGEFITTAQLRTIVESGEEPDGRFFHLSFDDGFANVYEEGGAILAEEGVPYVMFIATDLIGASLEKMQAYNDTALKYRQPLRTMTWDQVRQSIADGAEIGCHTQTHARLSHISCDTVQLVAEISEAKSIIENETGRVCDAFAWPFGKHADIDEAALTAIKDAGFSICFSAERGAVVPGQDSVFEIPRHQLELHWPKWELELFARGYRD